MSVTFFGRPFTKPQILVTAALTLFALVSVNSVALLERAQDRAEVTFVPVDLPSQVIDTKKVFQAPITQQRFEDLLAGSPNVLSPTIDEPAVASAGFSETIRYATSDAVEANSDRAQLPERIAKAREEYDRLSRTIDLMQSELGDLRNEIDILSKSVGASSNPE